MCQIKLALLGDAEDFGSTIIIWNRLINYHAIDQKDSMVVFASLSRIKQSSNQTLLRKRQSLSDCHHEVIQHTHIHQTQGLLERIG